MSPVYGEISQVMCGHNPTARTDYRTCEIPNSSNILLLSTLSRAGRQRGRALSLKRELQRIIISIACRHTRRGRLGGCHEEFSGDQPSENRPERSWTKSRGTSQEPW